MGIIHPVITIIREYLRKKHVLVNNWENGWTIDPGTNGTIYIFFWPQLLEFLGFALLPIPFLVVWKTKRFR